MSLRNNDYARALRVIRERRQETLDDVSVRLAKLGYPMSVQVLHKTETGKRRILLQDVEPLCLALRVGVGDLFRFADQIAEIERSIDAISLGDEES